ncbi:cysteine desulfurase-like protein [Nocardiopsis sp. MG754419]|uniref:cysteine desulfurase-like protein n=1 Tax=Nocardiopsis sp. MG754419 TaxID=2259865 RepID=UPI001BACAA0B|nr:cysteine desulfurase-like protein [Nocardiopsis sp. MG754419]MBR8743178.1 cysteine desulfurase-like protein [Nocardiopsis sp. MG754419]
MTAFDPTSFRTGFPSLTSGIAHFDGPGGTQTPARVGEAIARTLTGPLSNRGGSVASQTNAERAVAAFRSAYADLLGSDPAGVVHGRSATQITYDFSRHLARGQDGRGWAPGDEVVVTRLDHDANVRPWIQAAERAGATVRWIDLDPATAEADLSDLDSVINERTRLVAVTAASNLLGTRPPVRTIADRAHRHGALVYVDAVHHAAHAVVDPVGMGADFLVCSPYKFLGPHCAVLVAAPALLDTLRPEKLVPSTDAVPERFEFGTLPYETLAGATEAVEVLADLTGNGDPSVSRRERLALSQSAIDAHEDALRLRVEEGLAAFGDRVVLHSRAADRTPTLFLTFPGRRSVEVSRALAERDVLAPAGSFYAHETFARLALEDDAGLRVGMAPYVTEGDVDRLLTALEEHLRP